MNNLGVLLLSLLFGALIGFLFFHEKSDKYDLKTLRLLHVIFRHGDRNPEARSFYSTNPFFDEKYYPEGFGHVTIAGKMKVYKTGLELRERYDEFLGDTWSTKYLDARTTDSDRTKMSLQLVLAGLYPPKGRQIWSSLNWQPIPYSFVPMGQDKELFPFWGCPNFLTLKSQVYSSPSVVQYLQRYNETFEVLGRNTGKEIDLNAVLNLFVLFVIQEELGFPLEEWTKTIYPEPLNSVAVDIFYLITNTTAQRRIAPGYFLKKVLSDTKSKMDGTLKPTERKMFLYSAHELNIATLLLSLNSTKITTFPTYGSYVVFEVHEINNIYGIKLFYQNYEETGIIPLKIPDCDYFCPFEDFYRLIADILPANDTDCYGSL